MSALLCVFVAFSSAGCIAATAGSAQTYHVRADGGSASQCNGLVDAPYRGNERGHACAWAHPFIALPPSLDWHKVAPRLKGGDTLIIHAGSYMMGYGAPETDICTPDVAYSCGMQSPPSGPSPDQPTRILGEGWDQGCKAPPELWGTQSVYAVLQLRGSSNVEVACLELTDHSSCIKDHCHWEGRCKGEVDACEHETYPFGTWAQNGLVAEDASYVSLADLDIHGVGNEGVRAGRLADWDVRRTRIWANGFAGWDADLGDTDTTRGILRFRQVEIAWSGCGERYPSGEIFGCWGQEEGGYGDGFGTGTIGGEWIFEDSHVHDNMQDGLDFLHMGDGGKVTMRRVRAEGNLGNQLKASGEALIEDSKVDGNCATHRGLGNLRDDDLCRANGDSISIRLVGDKHAEVRNNEISGQGGCLIVGAGGDGSSVLNISGNTLVGGPRWSEPEKTTCSWFLYESPGRVKASGNRLTGAMKTVLSGTNCRELERTVHDSDAMCGFLGRVVRKVESRLSR